MSLEENKDLVRRYFAEIWNKGNLGAADEFFAPDYKRYTVAVGNPLNRENQVARIAAMRKSFPDIRVNVNDILAEGDEVSVRAVVEGTQWGDYMGIAPTGKHMVVSAFDIFKIQNGKIVEHWGGNDALDLLRQLGATITPPKKVDRDL